MPIHSLSTQSTAAAEGILFAFESARKGSTEIPSNRAVVSKLAKAITFAEGASELNKSIFAAQSVRQILAEANIDAKFPEQFSNNGERLAFYSGIIYGTTGNGSATIRELPNGIAIDEKDKSGKDISKEIAVATLRVYNLLTSEESEGIGSGVSDLSDKTQVIKCISQLIAANVTSDQNILHGTLNAATALGSHFYSRGLLGFGRNSKTIANLAGIILSAFGAKGDNLAPLSEFHKVIAPTVPTVTSLAETCGPTFQRPDIAPEIEKLHHKQNIHDLTQEQCQLLIKILDKVVGEGRDLDTNLDSKVLEGIELNTLNRLGRDILENQDNTDTTVAELKLASLNPKTQPIDVIQAVSYRLGQISSTEGLSKNYLELAARAVGLAKDGVIENASWDLPKAILSKCSAETLRELAEDCLCEQNDPLASLEDREPFTSMHSVHCLDAFSFRLRSIAQTRE